MSGRPIASSAQLLGKVYARLRSMKPARAKWPQEFAADILKQFGATSLIGTKIYFVSDRTGHKEIWSMNYDGSDQKQFTSYRSITTFPAVSSDGTKIAFTTYPLLASSRTRASAVRQADAKISGSRRSTCIRSKPDVSWSTITSRLP